MSRQMAGRLSPGNRGPDARLPGALEPLRSHCLRAGVLQVSYSGPRLEEANVICLLDGQLDNGAGVAAELGLEPGGPRSDEQLLAAAYRRWGAALLPRLRGDFALLLWDGDRRRGLLARDQLGVRSLYLHGGGNGVLRFAGEVRSLLALLPSQPGPDLASVAHWTAVSVRPGPQTLYAGVRRLEPGTALLIDDQGCREERYWEPRFAGELDLGPRQLSLAMREGLNRSVRRRTSAPAAILMSGGLDSSSIAAVAARQEVDLTACSAVFPDHPASDESTLIEELTRHLSLHGPKAAVRTGGLVAALLAYVGQWRSPPSGWGDFWADGLLAAAAAQGATTVLGGDGGDELFAPRLYLTADRFRSGHPLQALALTNSLPGAGPQVSRRRVAAAYRDLAIVGALPERLQRPGQRRRTGREAPSWMLPSTVRAFAESDDPNAWKRLDGPRWWAHSAHGIAYGIEQGGSFEHRRRRATVHGLEARHPMLDLDLVELALRQPPRATFDTRFDRPVLRDAMRGLLPDSVRLRPAKAWFDSLMVDSLTTADGALVRHLLSGRGAEIGAYVDLAAMNAALFESNARRTQPFRWMWQVWRLLTAEVWLRSQTRSVSEMLPLGMVPSQRRIEFDEVLR